jgi:hypothetical protein
MKKSVVLALAILALLLSSCAVRALSNNLPPAAGGEPEVGYAFGNVAAEAPVAAPELDGPGLRQDLSTDQDRLVIQTAALTMVVTDPVDKAAAMRRMAESMGGYVVSSYIYQSTYGEGLTADNASITVRVPADRLSEALEQLKADAVEVRSENITGQDVTAQYVDLQSRLRNLEAAEDQLMEIMDSAVRTEDVLAVYNQLVATRGEIEMVKGQMQYYEESAAYSSISAELLPDEAAQPIDTGSWQPGSTLKAAIEALINALQWLVDAAIWFVIYVLPVVLIVLLPIWLIVWLVRRRRAKKAMTPPPAA